MKERQDLHTPSRQTNEQPLTTSEHTFDFAYTDFLCHLKVDILSLLYLCSLIVFEGNVVMIVMFQRLLGSPLKLTLSLRK